LIFKLTKSSRAGTRKDVPVLLFLFYDKKKRIFCLKQVIRLPVLFAIN